jgi:hypothetical protein
MRLNEQDKAALRALDADFTVSADGELGSIRGEMEVVVVRPVEDDGARLLFTLRFPGGEKFDVRILRMQLLQEFGVRT